VEIPDKLFTTLCDNIYYRDTHKAKINYDGLKARGYKISGRIQNKIAREQLKYA
jgi:hypothetical protein